MTNILISKRDIRNRIYELSVNILRNYVKKDFILLIIMNGAFRFASDLIRELNEDIDNNPLFHNTNYELDFTKIRTYDGVKKGDQIDYQKIQSDLAGKNILIVDDILDTGETLGFLIKELTMNHNPASIKTCVLLDKKKSKLKADFVGFDIEDKFVVGYGMDHNEKFRQLNDIIEYKE